MSDVCKSCGGVINSSGYGHHCWPTKEIATLTATIAQQQADLRTMAEDWKEYGNYDDDCDCRQCVIARKVMEGER